MLYYFLQVGLLMLAAYLLGAMLGCMLYRFVAGGSTIVPKGTAAVGAAGAVAVADQTTGSTQPPRDPNRPVIETGAMPSPPEARIDTASRFERVLDEAPADMPTGPASPPAVEQIVQDIPEPAARETDASAALAAASVAAAAAAAAAVAQSPTEQEKDVQPVEATADQAPAELAVGPLSGLIAVADGPANDLKQIRSIDNFIEGKLNAVGVTRFSQIAGLTAAGVEALGGRIGETARINQENWIEQATLLAKGSSTIFTQQRNGPSQTASMWDLQPGDNGYTGPIFGGAAATIAGLAGASMLEADDEPFEPAVVQDVELTSEAQDAIADDARASVYG
ncbi:MAG: hypothetical protein AAFV69_14985, partial [Pseudomonadota bacterium]